MIWRVKYATYLYKPLLKDLSQGSRIAFVRQFCLMTQDELSDKLGLTGECKRRTMTRYEKGKRNPKDKKTMELAKILNVNMTSRKNHFGLSGTKVVIRSCWSMEQRM